ncbi:uncharacterized protein PAC_05725 [Phialocephala subalpina]|uniref:2EXR domain-containing protein n=1 Tax=Phialocephala subalpina TaxID=576137 RepID=A0A1L7WSV0_9HELO|nr:uncharacterized protein PAC_05725 [Phialocephala subalpina]
MNINERESYAGEFEAKQSGNANVIEAELLSKNLHASVIQAPSTQCVPSIETMDQSIFKIVPVLLEDSTAVFSVFENELPDRDQVLYIQLGKDLDIFERFSKLPIEIRLRIWRFTFPNDRHMCMDTESSISHSSYKP